MSETDRWWKLYREERRKIAPKKGKRAVARAITGSEIVRCAREATKRFKEQK